MQAMYAQDNLYEIVTKYGVSARYLWERAKRGNPDIELKLESLKKAHTEQQRMLRHEAAEKYLNLTMKDLRRIIFVDESSVPLEIFKGTYIGVKGDEQIHGSKRKRAPGTLHGSIRFILAVNAAMGLVYYGFIQGGKTDSSGEGYKVSHSHGFMSFSLYNFLYAGLYRTKGVPGFLALSSRAPLMHSAHFLMLS